MLQNQSYQKPRWMRDLLRFLPLKSQFVLSGNVRDLQAYEVEPEVITPLPFNQGLHHALREAGYLFVIIFNPLTGFQPMVAPGEDPAATLKIMTQLGLNVVDGRANAGLDLLSATLERLVDYPEMPIALIIDFASRLINSCNNLSPIEHHLFTQSLVLSHRARSRPFGEQRQAFFNTILWIVEKEGDLPDWLLVNNPRMRHIPVAKPDSLARHALAPALLRSLMGGQSVDDSLRNKAQQDFVDETENLLLLDMNAIAQLARIEHVPLNQISDAVRRYKVGITDDPWLKIDKNKIRHADNSIQERVKGQKHAVTHMLDIIKRAVTGVGSTKRSGRPRGVVFLAGPTGVGKTELAKTITELLFGDENAYIRFDMSEFSAEHADQRLMGAPPGYIGYDVGGELTNAIREKPFSVVLFDEIEKAHPRLMDKFLQIIDDGVLTSGRGDRVYFSEALIIFTSNLGMYRLDINGERVANIFPSEPFATVQTNVKREIERHFKLVLNRPELLNRIGENIIVFDFIRPDVAIQIFNQMVNNTLAGILKLNITISLSQSAEDTLREICLADLSNGGRGIRNQLEAHLINPLSRALFDLDLQPNDNYVISELVRDETTQLLLTKSSTIA